MKPIIIAEAGVNHNGSLKKALKMVDIAANAKADFIKFQTFIPSELCQKNFGLAPYQKKNSKSKSQLDMLKSLSLTFKEFLLIKNRCKKKGIGFMSSPFDEISLKFLKKLKVNVIKIASGEVTNVPLIKEIGKMKKKVILSSGMCNMNEIKTALKSLISGGTKKKNITVLHCNTEYPATITSLNLKSIKYIKDKLKLKVGFSDHSKGIEASLIALGFGATVLEKHFTLNKKLEGPDHKASLDPKELKEYIYTIRKYEKSLGGYFKRSYGGEISNIHKIRKFIVAKKIIKKGDIFNIKNITTKRAKKGIAASKWNLIIGKKSNYDFEIDENIRI